MCRNYGEILCNAIPLTLVKFPSPWKLIAGKLHQSTSISTNVTTAKQISRTPSSKPPTATLAGSPGVKVADTLRWQQLFLWKHKGLRGCWSETGAEAGGQVGMFAQRERYWTTGQQQESSGLLNTTDDFLTVVAPLICREDRWPSRQMSGAMTVTNRGSRHKNTDESDSEYRNIQSFLLLLLLWLLFSLSPHCCWMKWLFSHIFSKSPSASVCQGQMNKDASVSFRTAPEPLTKLVSIIRDIWIGDNLSRCAANTN